MSKTSIYLLLVIAPVLPIFGQVELDYDWPEDPTIYVCPDSLLDHSEVILFSKRRHTYDPQDFGNSMEKVEHYVSFLNSDEAIEANNRIYLPISPSNSLVSTKARVIKPNSEIMELNEEDIITHTDEIGNVTYYYAIKGLERGSIVEVLTITQSAAVFTGVHVPIQSDILQLNCHFEVIAPSHLDLNLLDLNGFGEMNLDTTSLEDLNVWSKTFDFVPALEQESSSFYFPYLIQTIYKLNYPGISGSGNVTGYNGLSENMLKYYMQWSKKERKVFKKWLKTLAIPEDMADLKKIQILEQWLKTNFAIFNADEGGMENLETMEAYKMTNPQGMIRVMILACEHWGIPSRLVLTSDRSEFPFHPDFEAYTYLQYELLYFSTLETYFDPHSKYSTIGIIPQVFTDNYGVFYTKVIRGDFEICFAKVEFIEGLPAEESQHNIYIDARINESMDSLIVQFDHKATGYFAADIQPYYDDLKPEDIEEINEMQVTWIEPNLNVYSVHTENEGFEYFGKKPFLIRSVYGSADLIQKVRNTYLLKVGLLIGPQVEMYQEEIRKLPVDIGYRKAFNRSIRIEIPEGYRISNAEDLLLTKLVGDVDSIRAGFESTYVMNDSELTIEIREFYHDVQYDLEEFEAYREVINSAADFNKIILFLEPEATE